MKLAKLLALLLLLLSLTGCWDMHELENNTFVIIMGVDLAEDGDILVTIAFPQTQSGGNASAQGEKAKTPQYEVMSAKAPTILEGLNLFTGNLSSPLALYSLKTVVLSEALARSDQLKNLFSVWRTKQMRNTANVLVSRGEARQFVEARIKDTVIDPLRQEELFLEQANGSGYTTAKKFLNLIIDIQANGGEGVAAYGGILSDETDPTKAQESEQPAEKAQSEGYLPGDMPLEGKSKSQICGLAVFTGNKMVGTLDSEETQCYQMLTGSKARKLFSLPDPLNPENVLVISLTSPAGPEVDCTIEQDNIRFDLTVQLRGTLESIENGSAYDDLRNFSLLEDFVRKHCEEKMAALIDKIQREYQADILNLGNKARRQFATLEDWERFAWKERYPTVSIQVHADLKIEQTGILIP